MTLNLASILIALLAFAAAIGVQLRGFGDDPATFRRKRRRAAFALIGLLLLLGLVQYAVRGDLWWRLFGPEEDGSWGAVMIDGRRVSPSSWTYGIRDRMVRGGYDYCNSWSYSDEGPDRNGERMIHTTLVGCPEDDPLRRAYWSVTPARPKLRPDGSLRLAAGGHEVILRRCEWMPDPAAPRQTRCVTR